jgi:hypothetical protein
VLLNPDKMFVSQEINGDMYLHFEGQNKGKDEVYKRDSRGAKAYKNLKKIDSKKELEALLNELYFDQFTEDEKGQLVAELNDKAEIKEMLSFTKHNKKVECEREDGSKYEISWYAYNWFSDYVFIKNNMGKSINLIDKEHQVRKVENQEVVVLYFGTFEKI